MKKILYFLLFILILTNSCFAEDYNTCIKKWCPNGEKYCHQDIKDDCKFSENTFNAILNCGSDQKCLNNIKEIYNNRYKSILQTEKDVFEMDALIKINEMYYDRY